MLCGLEAGCELLGSGEHGHGHVKAGAQTGSGHLLHYNPSAEQH